MGGHIVSKIIEWEKLTSDHEILSTVRGLKIDFANIPTPRSNTIEYVTTFEEKTYIHQEINKLLKQKVVTRCEPECGQVTSPIFLREKSDKSHRLILNLKSLNEDVVYKHFKMDTISSILNLVDPDCFMTKIDIKSAYYSVKIHEHFQKYLKFYLDGTLLKFVCMPNGLTSGPRIFTKLMKPVLAFLRGSRIILAIYIDDLINLHRSFTTCSENTQTIINMLKRLGFMINIKKSVTTPSKNIEFLGFLIDSETMTIRLTVNKKQAICDLCKHILTLQVVKIRTVAKLIGKLTSSFIGVMYGPLHYRYLDNDKSIAVKTNKGNYNKNMVLSQPAKEDIKWWMENIMESYNNIGCGNTSPSITITTDASKTGWGGTVSGHRTHGLWTHDESLEHINVLELKAVLFSVTSLLVSLENTNVMIMCDNTTAVHTINNMGTCRSLECHAVVLDIWEWARQRKNLLIATHIPGGIECRS